MAEPEIPPGDAAGDREALAFLEGRTTLEELNHWALAYVRDSPSADRHSRIVALLVLKLHATYGDEFLTPVLAALGPIRGAHPAVDEAVIRAVLRYDAAGPPDETPA